METEQQYERRKTNDAGNQIIDTFYEQMGQGEQLKQLFQVTQRGESPKEMGSG